MTLHAELRIPTLFPRDSTLQIYGMCGFAGKTRLPTRSLVRSHHLPRHEVGQRLGRNSFALSQICTKSGRKSMSVDMSMSGRMDAWISRFPSGTTNIHAFQNAQNLPTPISNTSKRLRSTYAA